MCLSLIGELPSLMQLSFNLILLNSFVFLYRYNYDCIVLSENSILSGSQHCQSLADILLHCIQVFIESNVWYLGKRFAKMCVISMGSRKNIDLSRTGWACVSWPWWHARSPPPPYVPRQAWLPPHSSVALLFSSVAGPASLPWPSSHLFPR